MANLTLNEYQNKAMSTCMPESDNLFYMLVNLVGEVGEFASKAGKHMRKGKLHITTTQHNATRKARFFIRRYGTYLTRNVILCFLKSATFSGRLQDWQKLWALRSKKWQKKISQNLLCASSEMSLPVMVTSVSILLR